MNSTEDYKHADMIIINSCYEHCCLIAMNILARKFHAYIIIEAVLIMVMQYNNYVQGIRPRRVHSGTWDR